MMKHDLELGQHFMTDKKLLKEIVSQARITDEDVVLEIGSGSGNLTRELLKKTNNLICIEKDDRYGPLNDKIKYYSEDALKKITELKFNKVVANIPYHISEPLLKQLLSKKPSKIVLVTGKQFAEKLLSKTKIGIITRETYSIEQLKTIQPSSFEPAPKVKSSLLVLNRKEIPGILNDFFEYSKTKTKNYLIKKRLKNKKETKLLASEISFSEKKLYELSTEEVDELKQLLEGIIVKE